MTENEFRNPVDALVVSSVRTLLGNPSVTLDDNFLSIGGNSIAAIRLGHILNEKLGIPRTVRIIFKNPVLRDLSDAISGLVGEKV
ncbi:phosphopantetheine-binding protein [Streptomyces sp. W16]|uniref:phosphopantetheine-binding protein n=1 Tax=Streptomyces sp. W16 TaxID=3076631 RepID=UPI00295AC0C3|nr:phosphopantetheine-binding protein [Streptomyces sp. W16]MDV9173509.1 phosphopantetheine-binding protein [Streptomyces sp. W16]